MLYTLESVITYSLIYAIRKINSKRENVSKEQTIEIRNMKQFNKKNPYMIYQTNHGNMFIFMLIIPAAFGKFGSNSSQMLLINMLLFKRKRSNPKKCPGLLVI